MLVSKNYNLGGGFAIKYDLHGAPGQEMYELTKVSKIFDLQHFINTGETKTVPVKSTSVNPQSLTQQRQLFIEQMTQLKATNVQLIQQSIALYIYIYIYIYNLLYEKEVLY